MGRKCCESIAKLSNEESPSRKVPEATRSARGASQVLAKTTRGGPDLGKLIESGINWMRKAIGEMNDGVELSKEGTNRLSNSSMDR